MLSCLHNFRVGYIILQRNILNFYQLPTTMWTSDLAKTGLKSNIFWVLYCLKKTDHILLVFFSELLQVTFKRSYSQQFSQKIKI